jgi:hypothetical protein
VTCTARPTQDGHACARCRIRWDRDDETPPCPRLVEAPSLVPGRDPFVSALAPDYFRK